MPDQHFKGIVQNFRIARAGKQPGGIAEIGIFPFIPAERRTYQADEPPHLLAAQAHVMDHFRAIFIPLDLRDFPVDLLQRDAPDRLFHRRVGSAQTISHGSS